MDFAQYFNLLLTFVYYLFLSSIRKEKTMKEIDCLENPHVVKKLIEMGAIGVNALSKEYYEKKHIEKTINVPADSSEDEIQKQLPDKDKLYITYCANEKCPKSNELAQKLQKMGYKYLLEFSPGMEGWEKHQNEECEVCK